MEYNLQIEFLLFIYCIPRSDNRNNGEDISSVSQGSHKESEERHSLHVDRKDDIRAFIESAAVTGEQKASIDWLRNKRMTG